jgi:hypothetical protein
MSTSIIGSQLDAIRAGLVLVPGLAGVNIFSGAITPEEAGQECIAFGDGTLGEIPAAFGGEREETWTVGGEIRIVKPWADGTELTIKAARDRALTVFALLETYLNDTYVGALPDAELIDAEIENTFGQEGRICSLRFNFTVHNLINP